MSKTDSRRPGGWYFKSGGEVHLFHWVADKMVTVCGTVHPKSVPGFANEKISCRKCRRVTEKDHPDLVPYLDNPTGVEPVDVETAESALAAATTNTQYAEWARTYGKQIIGRLRLHP